MKENNEFLNNLFENLTSDNFSNKFMKLELFITPVCNQKCSYCYLQKYMDQYYPPELRNSDNILKNTEILLNNFRKKGIHFSKIDLYAGEIWSTDLAYSFFDILYNFLKDYKLSKSIMIPSNMSFLANKDVEKYYRDLIKKFYNIGVSLKFSASIDGFYLDETFRSRYNQDQYTNDFYNTIFKFNKDYGFGFHPMVSAESVRYWIDNFDWFMSKFKEFGIKSTEIMMLEVRDDNWTEESINELLSFLDYEINWYLIHEFKNDKVKFAKALIKDRGVPDNIQLHGYENRISCSIQHSLTIRLGDLSWGPCHRTFYNDFIYGKFIPTDSDLNIEAKNSGLAHKIYYLNPSVGVAECNNCIYNKLCMKGCLGAQLESNNYLFTPCSSVCLMEQMKINFLINKYSELGIFKIWEENNWNKTLLANVAEVVSNL